MTQHTEEDTTTSWWGSMHCNTLLLFVLSTSFLCSAIYRNGDLGMVVFDSASMLGLCGVVDALVHAKMPTSSKGHYVRVHFLVVLIKHAVMWSTYLAGGGVFLRTWRPLTFGSYVWDNLQLLCRPREFSATARIFLAVHHALAFAVCGIWIYVSSCCEWDPYIVRGIMLWWTADLYACLVLTYRSFYPEVDWQLTWKLRALAFILERIQRFALYSVNLVERDRLSRLAWVVLASGIVMDTLDTTFQTKSLVKHSLVRKADNPRSSDEKDPSSKESETPNETDNSYADGFVVEI